MSCVVRGVDIYTVWPFLRAVLDSHSAYALQYKLRDTGLETG